MSELKFATGFLKTWKALSGGFAYRIPDHYKTVRGKPTSFKRPADYVISTRSFTAFAEFKYQKGLTFRPITTLRPSQLTWIRATSDLDIGYVVVVGHAFGNAYLFDGQDLASRERVTFQDEQPLGWFNGLDPGDRRLIDSICTG